MHAVTLALLLLVVASPGWGEALAQALDRALGTPALRGARIGALVVDPSDGRELYARSADRPLIPASNQKILTALVALDAFGPTHRFVTRVWSDAPPDAGGGVDRLFLEGGGDPALTSEQWWRLAADLRLAGLREVRGALVFDESRFDAERWHPSWGRVSSRAYWAPIGALSANYGAFAVRVTPGAREGEPAAVVLDPPVSSLRIVNRARTAPRGTRASLRVDRVEAGDVEEVRVEGSLAAGEEPRRLYRSVAHPARYAAAVARLQLEANGIRVGPQTKAGRVPEGAHELLAFEGRRLSEIVRLLVKYSNNEIAETLLKHLGLRGSDARGTWEAGAAAFRARLAGLGVPVASLTLVDGSGLSYRNRVTARSLVAALRLARDSVAVGPELLAALPIAAGDGTLEKRADVAAGRVRAKSGLLDRVTALSGYAELDDGRSVVFSLLVNGYRGSDEGAIDAVDGFVAALVKTPSEGEGSAASRAAWLP